MKCPSPNPFIICIFCGHPPVPLPGNVDLQIDTNPHPAPCTAEIDSFGLNPLPVPALGWLIGGGTAYTVGTAFFLWQRLPFSHSIWHLFVLGGTVSHFVAILHFVHPSLNPAD